MNWCEMAKDGFGKSKSWVEEGLRGKGSGALLLAPAIGYFGGLGSACGFILKCAASNDNCRKIAKNRFQKTKSWAEIAKNGFAKSKYRAVEKIRARGIRDEHRDLAVKVGGALLVAAMGFFGGLGGACGFIFRGGSSNGRGKLMKAPSRPGEFIARAAFEANTKAYFRGLRGKHP